MQTHSMPPTVPKTSSPVWPGTVACGNPGMSSYLKVTLSSILSDKFDRPEPHMIPTTGRIEQFSNRKLAIFSYIARVLNPLDKSRLQIKIQIQVMTKIISRSKLLFWTMSNFVPNFVLLSWQLLRACYDQLQVGFENFENVPWEKSFYQSSPF